MSTSQSKLLAAYGYQSADRSHASTCEPNASVTKTQVNQSLFPLGRLVATPGALELLTRCEQTPLEFLSRHAWGDWGECDPHDSRENDLSVKAGFRILSVYRTRTGETLWVITEADRSATTILLPSEY